MKNPHSARPWGILALVLLLSPALAAHEGHKKPSPSPVAAVSPSPAADETTSSPEADTEPSGAGPAAADEAPQLETPPADDIPNPLSPFPWKSVFTEHLHNKIIH